MKGRYFNKQPLKSIREVKMILNSFSNETLCFVIEKLDNKTHRVSSINFTN